MVTLSLLTLAPIRLEAESARLVGASVSAARPGFSGSGFATGFQAAGASASWNVTAKAGVYVAKVGFSTPNGNKGFDLEINGRKQGGMFPDTRGGFSAVTLGRVELREGMNEVSIQRGWGFFDLDYVELSPAPPISSLKPVPAKLANPQSDGPTRALWGRLRRNYGKVMLSGQYEINESDWIRSNTGQTPAVLGGDFMDYSPSRLAFGAKPEGTSEAYIKAAKAGQIVSISWHWNAPQDLINKKVAGPDGKERDLSWYKGFYTEATTFDIAKALQDPQGDAYRLIVRDIDAIAVELKKFQTAGVPVLWRPLHEAEGGWFWWGAKGPEPCKALWKLMFNRLTQTHRLNNLIWVWNSADPAWYPGDDTVDVVSIDSYPSDRRDPLSGSWDSLLERYNGRKLLALAEFPGVPDVERMFRFGVRWSYFVSWTGSVGPKSSDPELLQQVYRSKKVRNRPVSAARRSVGR